MVQLGCNQTNLPGHIEIVHCLLLDGPCRGELPADYGFDPLSLAAGGSDPAAAATRLERYVELELLHARWAMLGALGARVPGVGGGGTSLLR